MKHKLLFVLALIAGMLTGISASATPRSPYNIDFESDILTGSHDFALASGWGHIVDSYFDDDTWEELFVDYSVMPHSGVNGSTALAVGNQVLQVSTDYGDFTHQLYDLLVTPAVTGTVTLDVKQITTSGNVWFYYVTEGSNGTLSRGQEITLVKSLNTDGYSTVTLSGLQHQRIGIRVSNCLIDNFHADEADVALTTKLKIARLDMSQNGDYADADENGDYAIRYKVTLTNNGDVDLNPGAENYSLSVSTNDTDDTVYTAPITVPLAVGQTSDPIDISFLLNIADYPGSHRYDVIENVSGTRAYGSWIHPAPHDPVFWATLSNSTDTLANGSTLNFGTSSKAISHELTLHNDGATALEAVNFAVDGDFTTTATLPLTVPAHGTKNITVTMNGGAPGQKTGQLELLGNNVDYALNLAGTVIDSTKWFVDFEDNAIPANMVTERNWDTYDFPNRIGLTGNVYCAENYSLRPASKIISPLLEVQAGDSLTFEAAKRSDNSYMNIYYSADRQNWVFLDSISDYNTDPAWQWNNTIVTSKTDFGTDYTFGQYTLKNVPAGRWYIAFEAGYAYLDNLYGFKPVAVDHDLYIKNAVLPATAKSNNVAEAKVTIHNANVNPEAEGTYTATLYLDGQAVATAQPAAIAAGADANYTFSFAPHAAGTFQLYAELKANDNSWTLTTETTQIAVAQENSDRSVQVGNVGNSRYSTVPLDLNFNNSETETVYPARLLNIKAGDKITGLLYRGANSSSAQLTTHVSVWVDNAADTTFMLNAQKDADAAGLTNVFDGNVTFPIAGDYSTNADMLDIQLSQPVVYTGQNLRIVVRSVANEYKQITFEADNSTRELCRSRYDDNYSTFAAMDFGDDCLPVVHLSIASEPTQIEGTVTDAATGAAISGANVSLVNGLVEYDAVTDASGHYAVTVYQNTKAYDLTITAQGYNPYRSKGIDGATPATVNVSLSKATGLFVDNADIPQNGEVNAPYAVSATIANYSPAAIPASGYTASLVFDGNIVATATTADLAAGAKAPLSFSLVPHTAGTFKANVVLTGNGWTAVSDTIQVNVSEEKFSRTVQAGDSTSLSAPSMSTAPLSLYNYYSQSEILYTARKLNIPAGSHISSIAFRGYTDGWSDGTFSTNVQVYMENTADGPYADNVAHDTATMTKVYDGPVTINKKKGSETETFVIFSIPLQSDFVYDGTNLRVSFNAGSASRGYTRAHFVIDDGVNNGALARGDDSQADLAVKSYEIVSLPVAQIAYSHATTVSGRITGPDGIGIEGATVTLTTADGIEYTATTDASGDYTISVGRTGHDYTVTVTAPGYTTATGSVTVADTDVTFDKALERDATGITSIEADSRTSAPAYNLAGQRVNDNYRGIVVTKGHKVIKK